MRAGLSDQRRQTRGAAHEGPTHAATLSAAARNVAPMSAGLPSLEAPASTELEQELARQADLLVTRLTEGRERLTAITELAAALEAQLESDEQTLQQLDSLLGRSQQLPIESLDPRLRGARLREVAVAILADRGSTTPVHYRKWYAWLREAGYAVGGKDPLASFLAQVSRAPNVERVGGPRSGRYQLRTP